MFTIFKKIGVVKRERESRINLPKFSYLFSALIFLMAFFYFFSVVFAAAPSTISTLAATSDDGQVILNWTAPANGGSVITDYTVQYRVYGDTSWTTFSHAVSTSTVITVTGLTNGSRYEFNVMAVNADGTASVSNIPNTIPMGIGFQDTFESLTLGNINGQNSWVVGSDGTWTVAAGDGGKMVSGSAGAHFYTHYLSNSQTTGVNQRVKVDFQANGNNIPQIWLRRSTTSGDGVGYFTDYAAGTFFINKNSGTAGAGYGVLAQGATTTLTVGNWYTIEFQVINDTNANPVLSLYIYTQGAAKPATPLVTYTDTNKLFSTGFIGLGANLGAPNYDNVVVYRTLENVAPIAISDLTAVGGDSQAILNWTAPVAGGSAITDYTVQYRVYGDTSWTTFSHPVSTSTAITVTGLNNGVRYEFNVMAVNAIGTAPVSNTPNAIILGVLFQDTFDSLTLGNINGQNGWTVGGNGNWNVVTDGGGKIVSGSSGSLFYTNYIANGFAQLTNQKIKVDFQATSSNNVPFLWSRRTSVTGDGSGYIAYFSPSAGLWYIAKNSGTGGAGYVSLTSSAATSSLITGNWYTVEFETINNVSGHPVLSVYVYAQGGTRPTVPAVTYVDTANLFLSGYIGLGTNQLTARYDNLVVYGMSNDDLTITAPSRGVTTTPLTATLSITDESGTPFYIPYIQTSSTLTATATVGSSILPAGGGVKFVLNEGQATQQILYATSTPFTVNFINLSKGTYTIDTYVVNSSLVVQTGGGTHDRVTNIGIGDIITAIGDSITMGYAGSSYGTTTITNWTNAPAGSVSADNRNYPQYGPQGGAYYKSFMTEMNDKLSAYYGYPVFIMNEGWGGYKTSDYITLMGTAQWANRQTALHPNKWIIDLGVNDGGGSISTSTFRTNMQTIITSLVNTYNATPQNIFLSRPNYGNGAPYTTILPTYLPVVDTLISSNGLSTGPDFYTYFSNHYGTYYIDVVHPNVAGFTQIARLNYFSMIRPSNTNVQQSGSNVYLSWNSLSSSESTTAGYKVKYGTASGVYSTTVDVGNATSTTISGLTSGQTYYFTVSAYDNDAFSPNQSSNSSEVILAYNTSAPAISAISPVVVSSGATVTWTTDTNSSSKIDYGLTVSYGTSTPETDTSTRVTSHSVSLSGLASCTTYHYRVRSKDATLNEATSTDQTFTTSGCAASATVVSTGSSQIATSTGGTLTLSNFSLTVPVAFGSTDANFQAQQLNKTAVLPTISAPSGYSTAGSYMYELRALTGLGTATSTFDQALTITMSYSASDISGLNESTLKISRWDGASWNELSGCSINTSAKTVTCTTTHFSVFGLFGQALAQTSSSAAASGMPLEWYKAPLAPLGGFKISINDGAKSTSNRSVALGFNAGSDVKKMTLSLTGDFNSATSLEDYAPTRQINLCSAAICPNGLYTVSARFYNNYGIASDIISQSINLVSSSKTASVATKSSSTQPSSASKFNRDLRYGAVSSDVKLLQKFLNDHGYTISKSGAGSPGKETNFFGSATKAAVIRFQKANNIKPTNGSFGPLTRKAVNGIK